MPLLDCDLGQIEFRVAAFLSQDPTMIEEVCSGIDIHSHNCEKILELPVTKENRTDSKIFVFRAIYADLRTAAYAYYMDNKMPNFSQKKWDAIIENFAGKYSGLIKWHEEIVSRVRKTGELRGPSGRLWKFNKHLKKGGWYDYNVAQIYNFPVQGTAADLIKLALVYIQKRRLQAGLTKSKLCMTVHDSIIWDSPEDEVFELAKINIETFREIPELAKKHFGFEINVPIDGEAEYGPSWGNMKGIEI